ncbi:MAG TPA: aspartate aminotransferase family protein [Burkholderiales bacterium]|jgi:beta-alanine--pyruvate transaminase|nr:aspartate aminotransferase family protein [Burkholderiales bacterium]
MNKRAEFTTSLEQSAFWMPFTANRQFKKAPRLLARAEGMYYWTPEGRQILDACAGLWCVNAGHCRPKIVQAIQRQAAQMDFAPTFQMGHPIAFEFAERLAAIAPERFKRVFFTNSGSESVDSALKIALAYHRARGEPGRFRLIGRERGYHGVNFGGMSVGGLGPNRKLFGPGVAGVDHLRHTHDVARNAFSRGQPAHGAELAEDLERLCTLHDPSTIAAVIVEPVPGSAGVLIPPVKYLERLREICTKHGILLIFDEVITGFGRLGKPFGSQRLGVYPDLFTTAKGMTNGAAPMGAVFVREDIYEAFMQGPDGIELFHGYTYSGHPLACAAGIGALDTYEEEGLLERAASLEKHWENAIHAMKGERNVIDVRNYGLMGAIEFEPRAGAPGTRGYSALVKCFEAGVLTRYTADTLAFSPPLIVEKPQIDRIFETVRKVVQALE